MVTINALESELKTERLIDNVVHQHAFVLLGRGRQSETKPEELDVAFGVHMTQYHCELHKYQIILKYKFDFSEATCEGESFDAPSSPPNKVPIDAYTQLRKKYQDTTFFLCNANDKTDAKALPDLVKEFSIPQLGSQQVTEFHGHLFFGIRFPFSEVEAEREHFFPWSAERCKPVIKNIRVICERLVLFRPFDHVQTLPRYALYYLFGERDEAFMTHMQMAEVSDDPYIPKQYGPDYDDVIALEHAPQVTQSEHATPVLGDALLEAGVVVSVPRLPLQPSEDSNKKPCYPAPDCWLSRKPVPVMYRGIGPQFQVIPRTVYLSVSMVCNSPESDPYPQTRAYWTLMPERYWVT
jgi:hypothetical protein